MTGNAFDEDPFESITYEGNAATLEFVMRQFEKHYFYGIAPVSKLEVVPLSGPAKFCTTPRTIQINPSVSNYPRVARILILHELINHKLFLKLHRNPTEEEIQVEVDRLWEEKAYKGLL